MQANPCRRIWIAPAKAVRKVIADRGQVVEILYKPSAGIATTASRSDVNGHRNMFLLTPMECRQPLNGRPMTRTILRQPS